jgi:capsular exopolysaccharide synthesis family protein
MNREAPQEQLLQDAMRVLRRQKWVILLTTLIAIGAAVAYSVLKTPQYGATADLRSVDPSEYLSVIGVSPGFNNLPAAQRAAQTAQGVTSPAVVDAVAKDVNSSLSNSEIKDSVGTSINPDNNLITLTVTASKAKLAADLANAYADETKSVLTKRAQDSLRRAAKGLEAQAKKQNDVAIKSIILRRAAQLRSAAEVARPVEISSLADVPGSPTNPKPALDIALAAFLGLIFGVLLAFVRDSFDRRLKDPHEVQHQLQIPLLGYVQDESLGGVGFVRNGDKADSQSALEPFRILRSNVEFLSPDRAIRTLAVTSPLAEEGKSTVAAGLATAATLAGRRVLLVECDLRRPVFADRLDVAAAPGLADWASGRAEPPDVIQQLAVSRSNGKHEGTEEGDDASRLLTVISAGSFSPEPAELLASARFTEFVEQTSSVYDLVVFDCTPLLPVGDALEVLRKADAALLCIRLEQTTREQALAAKAALEHLPERLLGLVITGVRPDREGYYYGYYSSARSSPAVLISPGPGQSSGLSQQ